MDLKIGKWLLDGIGGLTGLGIGGIIGTLFTDQREVTRKANHNLLVRYSIWLARHGKATILDSQTVDEFLEEQDNG